MQDEQDTPIDFAAEAERVAELYHGAPEEDLAAGIQASLVNLYVKLSLDKLPETP